MRDDEIQGAGETLLTDAAVRLVRDGAVATITMLTVPAMEPAVMTVRGSRWSMIRPTRMPTRPETTRAREARSATTANIRRTTPRVTSSTPQAASSTRLVAEARG